MRIWSLHPKYLDVKGFVTVTYKQMKFEMNHLLKKLKIRDPERYQRLSGKIMINAHPLFNIIDAEIEEWEIIELKSATMTNITI